jgi:serine/threonine protein kinase
MEEHLVECPECKTKNPSDSVFCNKCGTRFGLGQQESASFTKTMLTPGEELTIGKTLAERYHIVEELGKGGMGFVYKVFDIKIQEDVALKVLKPEVAAHKDTITRFSNELKFARRITHKNVCRMHDINEAGGMHFITMEYVEGETLKSVVKRMGKFKLGNVLSIALQVTDGLAEAHSLGIVHRDLKPQNIMIDKEGNAKIMDFGIARSMEGKGLTIEGMVIGTPEYMSPEQVEGKKADQRSDI